MQINLLTETEETLQEHGLSWRAVKFIANAEGIVEIAHFVTLAKMFYYDNTGLEVVVDPTLVIVGGSWWLSRIVQNGAEKWFFHKKPIKPTLKSADFEIKVRRREEKEVIL